MLILCITLNKTLAFNKIKLNLECLKRKKKYVPVDRRIQMVAETLEETGDIERFLRNVSFFIQME